MVATGLCASASGYNHEQNEQSPCLYGAHDIVELIIIDSKQEAKYSLYEKAYVLRRGARRLRSGTLEAL